MLSTNMKMSNLKLGMSGSREGISATALEILKIFLNTYTFMEVHHGDCVGADAIFHQEATLRNIPIIIHPPVIDKLRAYCQSEKIREPKPYLDRNHDIVNETDILIAFPNTYQEVYNSGTWATIRYARNMKKRIIIVFPDGTSRVDN